MLSAVVRADVVFVAVSAVVVVGRIVGVVFPASWYQVQFENGALGLSLEGELEVFGPDNVVWEFDFKIIKTQNRLFITSDGGPYTAKRESIIGL